MIENFDIEYEKRLIDFLNYKLVGPDNSNRWIIYDENDNEVGFIQFKKIYKGNKGKGIKPVYAYCTEIESSTVSFKHERRTANRDGELIEQYAPYYDLLVKNNGSNSQVELRLSDNGRGIRIDSEKYGKMNFHIDYDGGLYLKFQSKTKRFNIQETVEYRIADGFDNSRYYYQLAYCPINEVLTDDNMKSKEFEVMYHPIYQKPGDLKMMDTSWVDDKLDSFRVGVIKGTVEETLLRHKMGLQAFSHFRFLLRKILPFDEDVIEKLQHDDVIEVCGLEPFFPSEEKKSVLVNSAVQN